jgi:hypothetical protein
VDDSTLTRRHGLEEKRRSGAPNALRGFDGHETKFLLAQRPIVPRVEHDAAVVVDLLAEDSARQILERVEELRPPSENETPIRTREHDSHIMRLRPNLLHPNVEIEVCCVDDLLHERGNLVFHDHTLPASSGLGSVPDPFCLPLGPELPLPDVTPAPF